MERNAVPPLLRRKLTSFGLTPCNHTGCALSGAPGQSYLTIFRVRMAAQGCIRKVRLSPFQQTEALCAGNDIVTNPFHR